jgi:hypothetical protein
VTGQRQPNTGIYIEKSGANSQYHPAYQSGKNQFKENLSRFKGVVSSLKPASQPLKSHARPLQ